MQQIMALLIGLGLVTTISTGVVAGTVAETSETQAERESNLVNRLIHPPGMRGNQPSVSFDATSERDTRVPETRSKKKKAHRHHVHQKAASRAKKHRSTQTSRSSHTKKSHPDRSVSAEKPRQNTRRARHRDAARKHATAKVVRDHESAAKRHMAQKSASKSKQHAASSRRVVPASATVVENGSVVIEHESEIAGVSGGYITDGGFVPGEPVMSEALPAGVYASEGVQGGAGCNACETTTRYEVRRVFCRCRSTCNMPPHMAYYPEAHGYYYFRPYNWPRVVTHQNIVTRWGGDWRHPYTNEVFKRVYARLGINGGAAASGSHHDLMPVPSETNAPAADASSSDRPATLEDNGASLPRAEATPAFEPESEQRLEPARPERGSSLPRLNDAVEVLRPASRRQTLRQQPDWERLENDLLAEDKAEAELVNFIERRKTKR